MPTFDYFYDSESRQFQFYSIPQMLFTEERFKKLSCEAKVLYGLLLNRSGLSAKNGWVDSQGRVYVYFRNTEICEMLGCQGQKATKIMRELDYIGLIERKKQGQGKPDRIYVCHFNRVRSEIYSNDTGCSGSECNDKSKLELGASEPVSQFLNSENHDSKFLNSENHDSGTVKITILEPRKSQSSIKSNKERVILSESYQSNPSESESESQLRTTADRMDEIRCYTQLVKENIEYDSCLIYDYDTKQLDELVAIMVECITSTAPTIRVATQDLPQEVVKNQLLKLDCTHIQYVLDSLAANTSKIRNIKAYLITTLYNAPSTISNYYAAKVQHDMPSLAKSN